MLLYATGFIHTHMDYIWAPRQSTATGLVPAVLRVAVMPSQLVS